MRYTNISFFKFVLQNCFKRRLKSDLVSKEIREAHESVREGVSHIRDDLLEEL